MQIKLPNNVALWARRLARYLSLGAAIVTVLHLTFSYLGFLHTDVDSARYMLSALVQSEAAIVALVVTLSLVAVQLAASSYSARVIEVFRRTPDLWILMGIYGGAMFWGLGVLKMIEKMDAQLCAKEYICYSNLEGSISGAYYLGVFAFVALVPYILKMFEMLKPSTVINMLADRITMRNILTFLKEEIDEMTDDKHRSQFVFLRMGAYAEKDPIQPIIDIVRSSLLKYDYETVRDGLRAIGERFDNIFKNETLGWNEERKMSIYIFGHLTRLGELTASREDEDSTLEIIKTMQKIGIRATMSERVEATDWSIVYLRIIGIIAVEHKFEKATRKVIESLEFIGQTAILQESEIATEIAVNAVRELEKVGIAAIESRLDAAATQDIWALEALLKIAKDKNLIKATQQIEESLKNLNKALGISEEK